MFGRSTHFTIPTLSCYSYSVRVLILPDPYGVVLMGAGMVTTNS